jgi:uncharacterized small protein (DUF1192 family)
MAVGSSENRGPLVLLLVVLVAAGGWNFFRNTRIDNAEVRLYRGYSDAELDELISVYQSEIDQRTKAYRQVADRGIVVQDRALLGDQVDEFERVQRLSQHRRDMAAQVTDNEISLEQLEIEQRKRAADRPIYKMIFRRLLTFGPI